MVDKGFIVVIENEAKAQLRQAYEYISKESPQNAQKVKSKILSSIKALTKHAHKHPADKYRLDNDGFFRAYELYKYRTTYHVSDSRIIVIRK